MEFQEIEVTIAPDGTARIEVRGVAGGGCLDVTAALEKALGGEVVSRELTADAYAVAGEQVPDHLRRGPQT
ncbi:DUF2997 domain-containing protein [Streptomyces synnematoformans]|uniref:DUF2997 domain-containing protein n=1 Tax=Streptomyces synnematoformans TaxID=415721 RepID=A0ABN2XA93_9ACTN